ncbi:hypothetical protein BJV82DRAFT_84790 [Fennellomyces sp. T-0311]|nr:hypothetical protein BJV82DRAFT_84790 [Fennellomyces sp. T-0311]
MADIKKLFELPLSDTASPEEARSHYESHLARIGRSMMEDHDLVMGTKRYTLLEVEAYLTAPKHGHADPYCHGHPRQKRAGYWFFHRAGMSDSFRGGSRKGVDITIGSNESAGGMLIRAVLDQGDGRVIEGPSLLVDEILKVCGKKDLQSLTAAPWTGDCWCKKSLFYLEKKPPVRPTATKRPRIEEERVYTSCRVGLGLGNRSPSIEARLLFVGRPYRYVMKPHFLKKGRVWTLFGLMEEKLPSKEIAELTQIKESLLPKYKSEFDAGREAPLDTIRECLNGKDIVSGGANWKLRVMSAVRWWECNVKQGEKFKLQDED